jgi:hypothetical protein
MTVIAEVGKTNFHHGGTETRRTARRAMGSRVIGGTGDGVIGKR